MMKRLLAASIVLVLVAPEAKSQARNADPAKRRRPNPLEGFGVEVYKTVGGARLKMYIKNPTGHQPSDRRPAIVFFFGGGWKSGSPGQFANHCKYLASRGMVAMAAEYRVYSRHQAKVADCVTDANSAIRWVRANASRLGVDPGRIASGGGSAGGHLAAAVATLDGTGEEGEDISVSCRPNAMLLFNAALDLTPKAFGEKMRDTRYSELAARMGAEPKSLSPTHNVRKGLPPAIIFHGTADSAVPYAQAERFAEAMRESGNRCVLAGYEGQGHGFFNFGRGGNEAYIDTLRRADEFLESLGFLSGEPTIALEPQN